MALKKFNLLLLLAVSFTAYAQDISSRLQVAVAKMENDPQFRHAVIALSVADSKTGQAVFSHNAQMGLAPASCQKVLTSIAAFELLGADFRYKTTLGYSGEIDGGLLKGNLVITGTGDPTLGSPRWNYTRENKVLENWAASLRKSGIRAVEGAVLADATSWSTAVIPDGWIWQDIGNYYGAGAAQLNWRENQFDIVLKSGKMPGDPCTILSVSPVPVGYTFTSEVKAGEKGSGDNAYIYLPLDSSRTVIRGTIPPGETAFTISGSFTNSARQLTSAFSAYLVKAGISVSNTAAKSTRTAGRTAFDIFTSTSPPLDSINYWFLKKSINLYGEALLKTIAHEKDSFGLTARGIEIVKYFWTVRGIEKSAINIFDGSGLSPQNRVTADALVKGMQFARTRPWFKSFYNALPEINGLSMKSGSIAGARSYTGYCRSSNGNEYSFAIIVNNFDGTAETVTRKIWALLDLLK